MSALADRIEQFRKMTNEDPENELGHLRLGQLLAEDNQHEEAIRSFERTLELSPVFSKVYQLLGESLAKLNRNEQAIEVLTKGYLVADERGDRMPREAMGKLLKELGAPIPAPAVAATPDQADGPDTGFRCSRPGCPTGRRAQPLEQPPIPDAIGQRIQAEICTTCWNEWKTSYSIKVINELRLDLSTEFGTAEYDKYMREFLGFEDDASTA